MIQHPPTYEVGALPTELRAMVLVVGIDPTTTDLSGQRLTIRPNELWGERRDLNPLTLESHSSRYPLCVRSHSSNNILEQITGLEPVMRTWQARVIPVSPYLLWRR